MRLRLCMSGRKNGPDPLVKNKPGFPGNKRRHEQYLRSGNAGTTTDFRPGMLESQAYMDENQSYFWKYS